jgi:hypothetical protein
MQMRFVFILFIVSSLIATDLIAQSTDKFATWKVLAQIDYYKTTDEYGEIFVPKFNEDIQALNGKEITLPGYIIPFEGMFKPEHIILSSLPVASCFFCGGGGPETVVEAYLANPVEYSAKLVSVTGTLELNDTKTDQLMYILRDAKVEIE